MSGSISGEQWTFEQGAGKGKAVVHRAECHTRLIVRLIGRNIVRTAMSAVAVAVRPAPCHAYESVLAVTLPGIDPASGFPSALPMPVRRLPWPVPHHHRRHVPRTQERQRTPWGNHIQARPSPPYSSSLNAPAHSATARVSRYTRCTRCLPPAAPESIPDIGNCPRSRPSSHN